MPTSHCQRRIHRGGFTFIELMIGLVITAMVLAAMAAVMTSVAEGWQAGSISQSTQMQANQIYARVQKILSGAKYVILPTDGGSGSSILFWANDDLIADSTVEAGELGLIQLDSATNTLYLYEAAPNLTGSQLAAAQTPLNWSTLQTLTPSQFISWSYIQPTPLGGPGTSGNPNALQVTGANFFVTGLGSTTQLPIIEFSLSFDKNGQSATLYNSTTMRGPTTQPN
ncbi:MAG: prepilin-type N-terminal cleavage/methylation domain-containing protein [Tepidisphaeraceae bacterium]|jgi:type II secretory pathway component PulJ